MIKRKIIIQLIVFISITNIFSGIVSAETIIVPTGAKDDTELIQSTLDALQKNDTILLKGDFVFNRTLFLPSNFTWILSGTLRLSTDAILDSTGWIAPGINAIRPTAITEKDSLATNINMSGGSYYGNKAGRVRFINFVRLTNSKFHDMLITEARNDNFTLGPGCNNNECRNLLSTYSITGNGLTDKGDHNYWYDCVVEYCLGPDGDGYTPKCRSSEFHRCVARYNGGPGFGMFCRIDGSGEPVDLGESIDSNKFIACVSHDNDGSGFSFNISSTSGEGGSICNNYVEALCFNNKESGVRFRNTMPNSIVENNEINLICFRNLSQEGKTTDIAAEAGGFGTQGSKTSPVRGITGSIIAYDNISCDVNLDGATNSNIVVYTPAEKPNPVIKSKSKTNTITQIPFNCSDTISDWKQQKYCEIVQETIPFAPTNLEAKENSDNKIKLSWTDNSDNELGYRIERKTKGSITKIAYAGPDANYYVDIDVVSGEKHTYKIYALNTAGNSDYSNEVSASVNGEIEHTEPAK